MNQLFDDFSFFRVVDQEVVDPVVVVRIVDHVLDRVVHLDHEIVEHDLQVIDKYPSIFFKRYCDHLFIWKNSIDFR